MHEILGQHRFQGRISLAELTADARPFVDEVARLQGTIVGMYAEDAAGRLTHPGTRIHAHVIFVDPESGEAVTAHLERVGATAGAVLKLPERWTG